MTIPEKLSALRALMEDRGYDVYLVPTDDNHQSEYVGEHFKARAFITGFTGSAGTAVITKTEAGLFTDGRYFIQAANQLEGSGITLFKMGQPDVPTLEDYIADVMPEGGTLGFDGRVVSMGRGKALEKALEDKHAKINYSEDLIDLIWEDRPPLSTKPAFALGTEYHEPARGLYRILPASSVLRHHFHGRYAVLCGRAEADRPDEIRPRRE